MSVEPAVQRFTTRTVVTRVGRDARAITARVVSFEEREIVLDIFVARGQYSCRPLYAISSARNFVLTMMAALPVLAGSAGCQRVESEQRAPDGPPAQLAAAALTDQEGRARSFADFRGKTVVFSFFFTSCPTVCPRETRALSEVQRQLSPELRERVQFVSLSVDPENDTPQAMRKFALDNGADLRGWSFVRASESSTRALAQELAVFEGPAKGRATPTSHTTAAYLFDATGRLKQRYAGSPLDVPRLAREIERLDTWIGATSELGRKDAADRPVTALK